MSESMKTVPGLLAEPADTWAKNLASQQEKSTLLVSGITIWRMHCCLNATGADVGQPRQQKLPHHELASSSSYLLLSAAARAWC